MIFKWHISNSDIRKINGFVDQNRNPLVERRISRNLNRVNINIDRTGILKSMLLSLLTSQRWCGADSPVGNFIRLKPFPISYHSLSQVKDVETHVRKVLQNHGLPKTNNIPQYFAINLGFLEYSDWKLFANIETILDKEASNKTEREIADFIDQSFKGFGSKQARSFLQTLGLSKYEIPIEKHTSNWLNEFGFPLTLNSIALQDRDYYHLVSDGIQMLCAKSGIFPCVLEAAISSTCDNSVWTSDNSFY